MFDAHSFTLPVGYSENPNYHKKLSSTRVFADFLALIATSRYKYSFVIPRRSLFTSAHSILQFKVMSKSRKAEQLEKFVRDDPVNALKDTEEILGCEMRPVVGDDIDAKKQISVKHYLVKWKGLSYLHCIWVPEKKFIEAYKKLPHLRTEVINFDEEMLLYEYSESEYVPISPRYTMVDRILACRQHEEVKEYLVKWVALDYDECHWESESDISAFQEQIVNFNRSQSRYHKLSKQKSNNHGVTNSEKKLQEFQQFEKSPTFLRGGMLLPHQLEGLNFLRSSWSKQTHVILEEETNSGKLIQSIAFQASLFEESIFPHLAVAPNSRLSCWKYEFASYAPHMNVVTYAGMDDDDDARAVIREYEFYFPESKSSSGTSESKQERIKFDVLLISYEMINIDNGLLKSIHWETMIVDERRRTKSKDLIFLLLKQFDTRHRTLLTGAPLQSLVHRDKECYADDQNNLDELFVPLHFVDAGKFANLEQFHNEFRNMNQEEQVSRLDKMLAPHLLRRSALKRTHVSRPTGMSISRSKSAQSVEVQTPVVVPEPSSSILAAERKRKAKATEATSSNPGAPAAIHRPSLQPDPPPLKKTKVSEGGVVVPETNALPRESFLSKEEITEEILPEVEQLLFPSSKNCVKGSTSEWLGMELVSDLLHGLRTALVVRRHFQDHAHAIAARKTAEVKLSEALEQLKRAEGVEVKLATSERELVKTQTELKTVREEKVVALEEMASLKARHAEEETKLSKALEQLKKADRVEAKLTAAEHELVKTQTQLKKVREEKKVALEEMVSLKARHAEEEAKLLKALEQLKKADGVEAKLATSECELVKTHAKLMRVGEEKKVALEEMVSLKARHAEEEIKLSEALEQLKKANGWEAKLVASERELVKTQAELKTVREEKKVALEKVMSSHVMIEGLDRKVEKLSKELEESEKKVRSLGEEDEVEAYVVMRTCTGLMKQVLDGRSPNWKRREVVDRFVALMGDGDAG